VTWGDARYGGDSAALGEQLRDVRRLCRLKRRFFEVAQAVDTHNAHDAADGEKDAQEAEAEQLVAEDERPTVEDLRWMRLVLKAGGGIFKEKVMPSLGEINDLLRSRREVSLPPHGSGATATVSPISPHLETQSKAFLTLAMRGLRSSPHLFKSNLKRLTGVLAGLGLLHPMRLQITFVYE
ncbi:unnamed protein product, partial [Symbiodinium sp. KB8]